MALARTDIGHWDGAGGTSFPSGSFTPPNNCVLVVCTDINAGTNPGDVTCSGGGLTWTKHIGVNAGSSFQSCTYFFTAQVVGTAVPMTVTLGCAISLSEYRMKICAFTGHNTSSPVGAKGSKSLSPASPYSFTLDAAPLATSVVVASVGSQDSTCSIGTGWTEINHQFDDFMEQVRTGSTSTTVQFNTVTGTAGNEISAGAIEINMAGTGGGGGGASSGAIYDLSYESEYWFDDTLFGIGWFDNDWTQTVSAGDTLVASNLTVTSPALGNPNCICAVAVGEVTGSPVLGAPNLINTKATNLTVSSPVLGAPNLVNTVAVGETTGSPVLGAPALAEVAGGVTLSATGLTVGSPVLGAPNCVNTVPVGKAVSSPVLGAPALTQLHGLSAAPGFATGPPVLGAPNVVNTVAAGKTVASPVLGAPALVATVTLVATALTVTPPTFGNPNVVNTVPAGKTVGSPVLGSPSLTNTVALGLTVGSPVLAAPRLGYVLVAPAFATGSPALGNPNCICMVAAGLTVGSPVLGAPYWQFTLWLADRVLDLGLNVLDTECSDIFLCSQRPLTYAEANTFAVGKKVYATGGAFGSPAAGSPGRRVTTPTIVGGVVSAAGTAVYWAAIDTPNSRLLSTGPLKPGVVEIGQGFDMDAFTIQMFG
jgi:hypothetical protein